MQSDLTGIFGEHFKKLEEMIKEMTIELSSLSKSLIEIQRDITLRRCVVKKEEMEKLISRTELLEKKVYENEVIMEDLQPVLGLLWQEQLDRIRRQQSLYKQKLRDLQYIQEYSKRAKQTALTLRPFAFYMASVIAVTNVRRSDTIELAPMEEICQQICNIEPDSTKRIEAIMREEEIQKRHREIIKEEEKMTVLNAKQNLKPTKERTRRTSTNSSSSVVVENCRERNNMMGTPATRSSKRRSKLKEFENQINLDICETSSQRSVSPRELVRSPTITSDGSLQSSPIPSPIDEMISLMIESDEPKQHEKPVLKPTPPVENVNHRNSQIESNNCLISPTSASSENVGIPQNEPLNQNCQSKSPQPIVPVLPISVIPPPPPPPPANFVAPIRSSISVDEPISPQSQPAMLKKPKLPSSSSIDSPSYDTVLAREQLLVAIKERFKKSGNGENE
uniref:Uncharacterized protein n=1 Tax=Panagrolaimus sp. JU765 TaxID=591449 RepID=A0AC34Q0U2_9BILA